MVRVDLSRLEFLDSMGLRMLREAVRHARSDGWRLEVDSTVTPQVKRLIDLTGVAPLLWP